VVSRILLLEHLEPRLLQVVSVCSIANHLDMFIVHVSHGYTGKE
jgi:hypothetical protein